MRKTKAEAVEEWLSTAKNFLVTSLLLDDQDLPEDDDVDDTFDLLAIHYILQATKNVPEKELYTYISGENLQTAYNVNEALRKIIHLPRRESLNSRCTVVTWNHAEKSSDVIDRPHQIF